MDELRQALLASLEDARLAQALDLIDRLPWKPRPDGEDYRMHLLRVAHRVRCEFALADPELTLAALLHDVLEDQAQALAPDPEEFLRLRFGERVLALVQALTTPPGAPYQEHVRAILRGEAGPIKLADFLDNALRLEHLEQPRRRKLAAKYAPVAADLREWLAHLPATHPLAARAAALRTQIALAYP